MAFFTSKNIGILYTLPFRKKDAAFAKYSSFNRRMLAAMIDSLLLYMLIPVFDYIAPIDRSEIQNIAIPPGQKNPGLFALMTALTNKAFVSSWLANTLLQLGIYLSYCIICWNSWSATPGKMLMRLKIVDAKTEKPIRLHQSLLRAVGYIISGFTFMLGFFWIGISKRRRGWHDYLADTTVIITPWDMKKLEKILPKKLITLINTYTAENAENTSDANDDNKHTHEKMESHNT